MLTVSSESDNGGLNMTSFVQVQTPTSHIAAAGGMASNDDALGDVTCCWPDDNEDAGCGDVIKK